MSKTAITKTVAIIMAVVIIVALGVSGYWYYAIQPKHAVKEVKIGVILPLTGAMATLGKLQLEGIELARIMYNEAGGIKSLGGANITYVVADCQSDTKIAMSEVERLITVEGLKILMGTYSSSLSMAATEAAAKYKVIYLENSATTPAVTERGFKYLFRTLATSPVIAKTGVEFVKSVGAKTVAILNEDSAAGVSMANYSLTYIQEAGLELVAHETYSAKVTDLSPIITKLKAANPDAVLAMQYTTDGILCARQMRELNWAPKWFIGHYGAQADPYFIEALKSDADYFGIVSLWNIDCKTPGSAEFIERFREMYGKDPTYHNAYPFMGAMVLFEVIDMAGSLDPDVLREAFLKYEKPMTINGYGVKFDPATGQNIWANRTIVLQIQGGQPKTVYPPEFKTADPLPMPPWTERT